jgi:hypothetical protein
MKKYNTIPTCITCVWFRLMIAVLFSKDTIDRPRFLAWVGSTHARNRGLSMVSFEKRTAIINLNQTQVMQVGIQSTKPLIDHGFSHGLARAFFSGKKLACSSVNVFPRFNLSGISHLDNPTWPLKHPCRLAWAKMRRRNKNRRRIVSLSYNFLGAVPFNTFSVVLVRYSSCLLFLFL